MKKIFSAYVLFQIVSAIAFGQDSAITVNGYVGVLNSNEYKIRNGNSVTTANFRAAGVIYWTISPKVQFMTFGVIQLSPEDSYGFAIQSLEYRPSSKWKIAIGQQATPVTELRGFPVSAGGQFETWTQTRIPGSTLNLKVRHFFSENTSCAIGVGARNRSPEYYLNFQAKSLTLAGYYNDTHYGSAALLQKGRLYSILVCNESVAGNTTTYQISKKLSISLWNDAGIDHRKGKCVRYEGGVYKTFQLKTFNGLFSVGYDAKKNSVTGYVFIHKSF